MCHKKVKVNSSMLVAFCQTTMTTPQNFEFPTLTKKLICIAPGLKYRTVSPHVGLIAAKRKLKSCCVDLFPRKPQIAQVYYSLPFSALPV